MACITRAVIDVRGGYYPASDPHSLTLGDGGPVRLAGDARLSLWAWQLYRVVESAEIRGPWMVAVVSYYYTLSDAAGREVLGYHWHPDSRNPVTHPHLHLGAGAGTLLADLTRAHLPTGPVSLVDVIRLAVRDFRVRPLRPDWAALLDRAQAALGGQR